MSRKPRSFQPGFVYHLISRFIDREWYITHDRERACYLELLGRSLSHSDWQCLSYGIMSSHVHLAMIAGREGLDGWIRRVHSPFADAMNKTHDRIGALFVRGPKDIATPPERVGHLLAYIHNNPVRAGVANTPAESTWTSHRAYLGLAPRPRWLHVDEGLARAGFSSPTEFDAWTRLAPDDPTRDEFGRRRSAAIVDELVSVRLPSPAPPKATEVIEAVAEVTTLSVAALQSRRRGRVHALARRAAVQCADALGIAGVATARALGISQQRVSAILMDDDHASDVNAIVAGALERVGRAEK